MRYFDVSFREDNFTSEIRAAWMKTLPDQRVHSNRTFALLLGVGKPAIIRLRELQLRLVRRGLVAPCMHWNPPRQWETYAPAAKTFPAPQNWTVLRGHEFRNRESRLWYESSSNRRTEAIPESTRRRNDYFIW